MTKNFSSLALAFMVSFALGCGGGPDDPATCTGGTVYDGTAQMCVTVTDTSTSTDTSTGTDTTTVTTTDTNTSTNVTIPEWFVVGKQNKANMKDVNGGVFATVWFTVQKVNTDGTYVAMVSNCTGNCSGVDGTWTGIISLNTFTAQNDTGALTLTGVIPATVNPEYARSSGVWSLGKDSGTYTL